MFSGNEKIEYYFRILYRRKFYFIATCLIITIFSGAVAYLLPPIYQSKATILIEEQEIPEEFVESTVTSFVEQRLQTITQQVTSRTRLIELINHFDLYKDLKRKKTTEEILDLMKSRIKLTTISPDIYKSKKARFFKDTPVTTAFTLSFEGEYPEKVHSVTNALASLYIEENLRMREKRAEDTLKFFKEELEAGRKEIEQFGDAIAQYKEAHLNEMPEVVATNIEARDRLEREIEKINHEIIALEERKVDLQSQLKILKTKKQTVPNQQSLLPEDRLEYLKLQYLNQSATLSDEHPDMKVLKQQIDKLEEIVASKKNLQIEQARLEELKQEFSELNAKYSNEHPDIKRLTKEITLLEEEIKSLEMSNEDEPEVDSYDPAYINVAGQLDSVRFKINVWQNELKILKEKIEEYNHRIESAPMVEKTYLNMRTDQKNAINRYNELMNKYLDARIALNLEEQQKGEKFTIIEPAYLPEKPYKPNRASIVVIGFIMAITSGLALVSFLEYIDQTLRTQEDVKHYLQLPALGIVPEDEEIIKDSKKKDAIKKRFPLVTDDKISSVFSEAFRSLRTNITFCLNSSPCRTFLVTSSIPKEGKSTMVINLGLTFSQTGGRVLIMDTDLRVPSLYKSFNLDHNRGLTNILIDLFNTNLVEGTLEEYGIGDIINLLSIQGKSGILTISDKTDHFQIFFKEGDLIDIQWRNRPENERLGMLLLGSGRITEQQRQMALKQQANSRQRLGTILINMNLISPKDIQGPLTLHFNSILHRILNLKGGFFRFQDNIFYNQNTDSLHYLKDCFSSWQEIIGDRSTHFLVKNIYSFIQQTPFENLSILTTGPLPTNPSELISSRRMKALMNIMKRKFDFIIMDSPPINSVTDASILASLVDGVLQVVHIGHVNRRAAQVAKQQLESIGAKIFGVILNRLNLKKDGYYYYSYYHYYYYGDHDKKVKKSKRKKKGQQEEIAPLEKS